MRFVVFGASCEENKGRNGSEITHVFFCELFANHHFILIEPKRARKEGIILLHILLMTTCSSVHCATIFNGIVVLGNKTDGTNYSHTTILCGLLVGTHLVATIANSGVSMVPT